TIQMYALSLHDALPIYLHFEDENDYELVSSKLQNPEWALSLGREDELVLIKEIRQMNLEEKSNISFCNTVLPIDFTKTPYEIVRSEEHTSELQSRENLV